MTANAEVLLLGPPKPLIVNGLSAVSALHVLWREDDQEQMIANVADRVRAIAISDLIGPVSNDLLCRFPNLEIISSFGVGYDHLDTKWLCERGVVACNTPDVLTEEVADTALGLIIATLREFSQAERYIRSGNWAAQPYPLSKASLRDRTIGLVGMGRISKALARRLEACGVPMAYHSRRPQADVSYRYYNDLIEMARAVDVLVVIVPGGPGTKHLINAEVLDALGPNGVLINIARGSVVDEPALIKALQEGRILSAGLDVYADEPNVPDELRALENVVLLPHIGSASQYTRTAMDQLVVDNLVAWAAGKSPLTPVAETPWPPKPT